PFLEVIWARACRRLSGDIPTDRLDRPFAENVAGVPGQRRREERGERLLENDRPGSRAGDLDMVERRPVALVGGFVRRVGNALEGELDILGRHLAEAIGPSDAGPKRELNMRRICLLDRFRRVEAPFPGFAWLVCDQPAVDR